MLRRLLSNHAAGPSLMRASSCPTVDKSRRNGGHCSQWQLCTQSSLAKRANKLWLGTDLLRMWTMEGQQRGEEESRGNWEIIWRCFLFTFMSNLLHRVVNAPCDAPSLSPPNHFMNLENGFHAISDLSKCFPPLPGSPGNLVSSAASGIIKALVQNIWHGSTFCHALQAVHPPMIAGKCSASLALQVVMRAPFLFPKDLALLRGFLLLCHSLGCSQRQADGNAAN